MPKSIKLLGHKVSKDILEQSLGDDFYKFYVNSPLSEEDIDLIEFDYLAKAYEKLLLIKGSFDEYKRFIFSYNKLFDGTLHEELELEGIVFLHQKNLLDYLGGLNRLRHTDIIDLILDKSNNISRQKYIQNEMYDAFSTYDNGSYKIYKEKKCRGNTKVDLFLETTTNAFAIELKTGFSKYKDVYQVHDYAKATNSIPILIANNHSEMVKAVAKENNVHLYEYLYTFPKKEKIPMGFFINESFHGNRQFNDVLKDITYNNTDFFKIPYLESEQLISDRQKSASTIVKRYFRNLNNFISE